MISLDKDKNYVDRWRNNEATRKTACLKFEEIELLVPRTIFNPNPNWTLSTKILADRLFGLNGLRVADIGTGSGVLAILAATRGAKSVVATDNDKDAIEAASINALSNGCLNKIEFINGDLFAGCKGRFDRVFANLPMAMGPRYTIDLYRRFLSALNLKLCSGGYALLASASFGNSPFLESACADFSLNFERDVSTALGTDWHVYKITKGSDN